jgi:hypothetical protein
MVNLKADQYLPPTQRQLDARLRAADKPGKHLWMVTAGWLVADPAAAWGDDGLRLLDRNNLAVMTEAGCFKCERVYRAELAARPCTGRLTLL